MLSGSGDGQIKCCLSLQRCRACGDKPVQCHLERAADTQPAALGKLGSERHDRSSQQPAAYRQKPTAPFSTHWKVAAQRYRRRIGTWMPGAAWSRPQSRPASHSGKAATAGNIRAASSGRWRE